MIRKRSLAALACAVLGISTTAHAWDPSRTHVGLTERAVETSDVHRRWMEGTADQLGWFTPLRVDPNAIDPETRRLLTVAMRFGHADVGAAAAGGPGACPPQPAPTETLQRCVDGDRWETSALGWLRVGIALEAADRTRLLHHFVDAEDPGAATWRATGRHRATWRRVERRAGGGLATRLGRGGFSGAATSALGWMTSAKDPFGPAALFAHQRAASLAATPADRDRHLALALVAAGALLHVVQDLSVPANARGDLLGMMVPLSSSRGDRGSPLAEYARLTFGRAMPTPVALSGRTEELAPPKSVREVLLGDGTREGLVTLAATHFLSDGRLPAPRVLDRTLDPAAAAAAWLGDDAAGLDPSERDGAVLQPWPAEAGYLRSKTGRALAAWSADDTGLVRAYLDRRVLREHALVLLPAAVQASVDTLELLWPQWPTTRHDAAANLVEIDPDPALVDRELLVVVEDSERRRTVARRVALLAGASRVRDVSPAALPEGAHVVLVLTGTRPDGQRVVIERRLDAASRPEPARETSPSVAPATPGVEEPPASPAAPSVDEPPASPATPSVDEPPAKPDAAKPATPDAATPDAAK
ncbi:MAG: hypothetical protein JNK45_08285 [Myxococcales bacterium]|nr:hypothetical protein [Myxococcales bacterium]